MAMLNPLILIANDDGIDAPGLYAAVKGASLIGDVTIVVSAPAHQQSGMGRALKRGPDVGTTQVTKRFADFPQVEHAQAVIGSPAQSVLYAGMEYLFGRTPDLLITGVNLGYNVGSGLPTSGTVGAAHEGWSLFGIPAMAVSSQTFHHWGDGSDVDWEVCAQVVAKWGRFILDHGLPEDVALLNINIPIGVDPDAPAKRTIVSKACDWYYLPTDGPGVTPASSFTLIDNPHEDRFEPDSDIRCVRDGFISVSPIRAQMAMTDPWVELDHFR